MEELIKELKAQNKTLSIIEATDGVEVSRIFQTLKNRSKMFDSITIASVDSVKKAIEYTPANFQSIDQYYKYLTQEIGKKASDFLGSDYGIAIICTKEVKLNVENSSMFICIYDKKTGMAYNCKPKAVNCNDATMPSTIAMFIINQLNAILKTQKQNPVQKVNKKR